MFFDTPIYLVFLTFVVLVYWGLPWRPQNIFLLCASYFFYGWWDWRFLALIATSTLVDFFCAHVYRQFRARPTGAVFCCPSRSF